MATLSGFFGLLACASQHWPLGILSYGVASRTKEIGIRMALGARSREVLLLISARPASGFGGSVWVAVVFASTRFASSLLSGSRD